MNRSNKPRRPVAVLDLEVGTSALVALAGKIVRAMADSPYLDDAVPSVTTLENALLDLQFAHSPGQTRAPGAVARRSDKRAALEMLLRQVKLRVQGVADSRPTHAAAIIESAGLAIVKCAAPRPIAFRAKAAAAPGAVKLTAPMAAKQAAYEWQYSVDLARTWVPVPDLRAAPGRYGGAHR